jgi:hypothetical protein
MTTQKQETLAFEESKSNASGQPLINTNKTKMSKTKETIIGVLSTLVIFSLLGIYMVATAHEAPYRPISPQAQTVYDSSYRTLCEAEKALANAKLLDIAHGVKLDADLNALNQKRDKECGF